MTEFYGAYNRFDPVTKDPDDSLPVELDLFELCANFWSDNEAYDLGEFIRPNKATGFSYEATTPGVTGHREPVWPRAIGQTVADGSVMWTCRAAGSNGINSASSPSVQSEPAGLSISGISVVDSTKLSAVYAAGVDGEEYDAIFTFFLGGRDRVARQKVKVRK